MADLKNILTVLPDAHFSHFKKAIEEKTEGVSHQS